MENPIVFGTDGWRAVIAEDFTFPNVRLCAQGVADYINEKNIAGGGFIIGYDTRFASESFAAAVAEVFAANDIPVLLCDRAAPTPTVSYNIVDRKASGGVIITASHNPPSWNGFKYKPPYGGSAPTEVTRALEEKIVLAERRNGVRTMPLEQARKAGKVGAIDPRPAYLAQVRRLVDTEGLKRTGLNIASDPMYGAGMGYIKELLEGGKTRVQEIHGERNPAFPGLERPEPISHNLVPLHDLVLKNRLDVGIATDGDADRVGGVDEKGEYFTPLQFMALLALYQLEVKGERGALVKSITMSSMLFRLGEVYKVPVFETPVGFKYIAPLMMEHDALIGGEESGGYGFRGHIPERDGVLSGLYLLDFMAKTGRTASELVKYLYEKVGPHFYDRWDLVFNPKDRPVILDRVKNATQKSLGGLNVQERDTLDGYRFHLDGGAWLLIRFSGTEPLLRVYAEADSQERVRKILTDGRALAGV